MRPSEEFVDNLIDLTFKIPIFFLIAHKVKPTTFCDQSKSNMLVSAGRSMLVVLTYSHNYVLDFNLKNQNFYLIEPTSTCVVVFMYRI